MDEREIMKIVVQREQARLAKNWQVADSLRDRLAQGGVTLFDKTSTWQTVDGRIGRIPRFAELESAADGLMPGDGLSQFEPMSITSHLKFEPPDARSLPFTETSPYVVGDSQDLGQFIPGELPQEDSQIRQLVQLREQARSQKDFAQSDKLRDELKALGVEVFDKDKLWRAQDGRCGVIIGYRGDAGPSDVEINTLVLQREKARQASDFATADMIRNELRAAGVDIFDKDKMWKSKDGRRGQVPVWDMMGAKPAGFAAPGQVQHLAPAGVRHQHVVSEDIQSQIIQAALATASNPVTAQKTLHLLQSMAASSPALPPKRQVLKSAPVGNMVVQGGSVELQETMSFCSQCTTTGRTPTDAEIQWLVEVREQMRFKKCYAEADSLRESMRGLGIELFEKEKRWSCNDGRQGGIPMFGSFAA